MRLDTQIDNICPPPGWLDDDWISWAIRTRVLPRRVRVRVRLFGGLGLLVVVDFGADSIRIKSPHHGAERMYLYYCTHHF